MQLPSTQKRVGLSTCLTKRDIEIFLNDEKFRAVVINAYFSNYHEVIKRYETGFQQKNNT